MAAENIVGSAFESTLPDVDHSSGTEGSTWFSYFTSFGIHIAMIIIVILLKWQYGNWKSKSLLAFDLFFVRVKIVIDIGILKDHVTGGISKMLFHFIEKNETIS